MIVGHSDKTATLQFKVGREEIVETDRGRSSIIVRSTRIHFKPLDPGILTKKISTRRRPGGERGRLLSFIDTKQEAEKLGISDAELIAWFKEHPSWNVRMIEVDEETTQVVGDEDGLGDGINKVGAGKYQCIPCDRLLDGRGIEGHKNSHAHIAKLNALRGIQEAVSA